MDAAQKLMPWSSEPLTWEQICERYPDEWVCLVDMDRPENHQFYFRSARVVGHGKTRREPFDQAKPWWEYRSMMGHFFTGLDRKPTAEELLKQREAQ